MNDWAESDFDCSCFDLPEEIQNLSFCSFGNFWFKKDYEDDCGTAVIVDAVIEAVDGFSSFSQLHNFVIRFPKAIPTTFSQLHHHSHSIATATVIIIDVYAIVALFFLKIACICFHSMVQQIENCKNCSCVHNPLVLSNHLHRLFLLLPPRYTSHNHSTCCKNIIPNFATLQERHFQIHNHVGISQLKAKLVSPSSLETNPILSFTIMILESISLFLSNNISTYFDYHTKIYTTSCYFSNISLFLFLSHFESPNNKNKWNV